MILGLAYTKLQLITSKNILESLDRFIPLLKDIQASFFPANSETAPELASSPNLLSISCGALLLILLLSSLLHQFEYRQKPGYKQDLPRWKPQTLWK